MQTITIDILNSKALRILQDLELLNLIRLRKEYTPQNESVKDWAAQYKGAMTKQPLPDIDKQLHDLRAEWE